jgi:N4-gp56 family major capsid protein
VAKTAIGTTDADRVILWEEELFREMQVHSFFSRLEGKSVKKTRDRKGNLVFDQGPNNLVHTKTQLQGEKNDKMTFTMMMKLTSSGVTSGTALEGKEESLTRYTQNIELEEYANAVRDRGPIDRMRPIWDMDSEAKYALQIWGAERLDELMFQALQSSPTRVYRPGTDSYYTSKAAATTALTATETITTNYLSKLAVIARTGAARSINPLMPITVDGRKYYAAIFYPDALYDFKNSAVYHNAAKDARERGKDNPLFTNATAIWDGIIIYEHENMNSGTDAGAGSDVPYSEGVLMGAQALVLAWGKRPFMVSETFDYTREHGHSLQFIMRAQKPNFNSKDYGSIGLMVARTQISDAAAA